MSQGQLSSGGSLKPHMPASRDRAIQRSGYSGVPYADAAGYGQTASWDSGSLAQYWRILVRRKGALILSALLGALSAFVVTRIQTPVYRAQTSLEMEDLNADFLNMKNVSPTTSGGSFQSPEFNIRTQIMVLQSRPVLERAIDKMGLEKRLLAKAQAGRTFPWARGCSPDKDAIPPRERAVAAAADMLKVRAEPNTRVVEITADAPDPQVAADLANSLAAGFTEFSLEKRWQTSQNTSEWLTKQLTDVKAKLEKAEDALQKYASSSDLTFTSEKGNAAEERLLQLQQELSKAQADRIMSQSKYESASTAPAESLPEVLDDATLREYQVQLTTLRRQLAELSASYTAEHPKVVNVKAQIITIDAALEKKRTNIVSRVRNEYATASRREKLLSSDYAAQLEVVSKQASKVAHYSILKREVDANRQLYDSMMQRVKEAGLATAMQASDIHVVESANPPRIPYSPSFFLNTVLGLLTGTCIGVAFIIQRARSDRGIQEPGQLTLELNVPELGVIPTSVTERSQVQRLLGKTDSPGRLELTTWQQWPSVIAESFRVTLTSILLSEKNGVPLRTIVVSSANPSEGKTTVISNLGIALARTNRRVLLVDGDMRKPRLHDVFEVDNSVGLSDVLAGNASIAVRETKVPNLFLLPSGASADERLLFTSQLRQLLRRLKDEFDMVLIDTPPLLQMSDARLMGNQADAVILVVAQHTDRDAVLMCQQRLAEDGSYLLGTILNNWNPKTSSLGNGHYGEYYKRAYSSDGTSDGKHPYSESHRNIRV